MISIVSLVSIILVIPLLDENIRGVIALGGLILLSLEKMMIPFLRMTIPIPSKNIGLNVTS